MGRIPDPVEAAEGVGTMAPLRDSSDDNNGEEGMEVEVVDVIEKGPVHSEKEGEGKEKKKHQKKDKGDKHSHSGSKHGGKKQHKHKKKEKRKRVRLLLPLGAKEDEVIPTMAELAARQGLTWGVEPEGEGGARKGGSKAAKRCV